MSEEKLAYRLLSGTDDRAFCEKVSRALADGYVLYGEPRLVWADGQALVAQAVVLRDA